MTRSSVCANGIVSSCPYRSTGKERDSESGNDYFEARYYSSAMGRFMSPDWSAKEEPVPYAKLDDPQTLNLYSYVGNNPLSRVDADGHCFPFCLALAGGGAAALGGAEGGAEIGAWAGPVGAGVGIIVGAGVGYLVYEHYHNQSNSTSSPQPSQQPQATPMPAAPKPPDDGNKGNKKTEHGEQRSQQAKDGDTHRQVGDANRVKTEGRTYTDSDTGNTVHVKGNRVVITDSEGNQVTQFKNTRANTAQRVQDGKWVPNK